MIAAAFTVAVDAWSACGPTPEKYRNLQFGDARFAIEENCRQTFTQEEQFFLAGIAQQLRSTCRLPRDGGSRALVERFTSAASLSLDLQKRQPSHVGRASAFAAGRSMMDDIACNGPEAALLARGILIYLKQTAGASRFVGGCVETYARRYAEADCRCMADALRPVVADVDQRFFDRALVKESIHRSPPVALRLMLSCGISEY
jgi:hypothetical protein